MFFGAAKADYRVVATDHTSYAIINSCTSFGSWRLSEAVWLLGRDKLEKNSSGWNALMDIVDPLYKKYLPDWDYDGLMRVT